MEHVGLMIWKHWTASSKYLSKKNNQIRKPSSWRYLHCHCLVQGTFQFGEVWLGSPTGKEMMDRFWKQISKLGEKGTIKKSVIYLRRWKPGLWVGNRWFSTFDDSNQSRNLIERFNFRPKEDARVSLYRSNDGMTVWRYDGDVGSEASRCIFSTAPLVMYANHLVTASFHEVAS